MNIKHWLQSLSRTKILYTLGGIILALIIFRAGMFIGFQKARHSFRFGERYYQTFGGGKGNRFFMGMRDDLQSSHGASGKIVGISLPIIMIEEADGTEEIITTNDKTVVRRQRDTLQISDLREDDQIVVIGSPNNNDEIDAKLIRIMPQIPIEMETGTTTEDTDSK